ncbi:hypothetical protein [Vibrio phage BUCT006]|nr:hypothetical protein [Vibrio phage BUCT006]
MDLNKLRVIQMIQLALAKKGIGCHVDTTFTEFSGGDAVIVVFDCGGGNIVENFNLNSKTESELLEWHAEIERV